MAAHSNRSPSPLSSRPVNPNPRNSETHHSTATRRSFNGKPCALTNPRRFVDPVAPANSPSAEFVRRRSMGDEKENDEKDHIPKTSKLQSPAKGCKSFMAPTISAASKFTPSPRKKTLERNDPVRTSISLSDGKAMFFSNISGVSEDMEPKTEMGCSQNQKIPSSLDLKEKREAAQEGHPVSKPSKKVTFLDVPQDSVISDSDSLKVESNSKNSNISCSSILPTIAPLDADPSMPPYDPKTNYLSPRPQFLYYKPNPRIEVLLNKEKGMMDTDEFKPLEDSFMNEIVSDNFSSDSEATEEDYEKEKMEAIASADIHDHLCASVDSEKEKLEAIASADMVRGLDFSDDDLCDSADSEREKLEGIASAGLYDHYLDSEREKLETIASADLYDRYASVDSEKEKLEAIASADMVMALEETDDYDLDLNFVQKNEKRKAWGLSRLMCFSMFVMLLVTCVSVSVTRSSPSVTDFSLNDLSFSGLGSLYQQSRVFASETLDLGRLVRHVNQLSADCVSLVSKVANELGKGEKTLGPLKYVNLSDLQMNSWNSGHFSSNDEVISEDVVEILEGDDDELDIEMDNFEEEVDDFDESFEDETDTQEDDVSEIEEENMATKEEACRENQGEEIIVPSISSDQLAAIPQDQESELEVTPFEKGEIIETAKSNSELEVTPEIVETAKSDGEMTHLDSFAPADVTLSDKNGLSNDNPPSEGVQSSENKFLAQYHTVVIIIIISLFAALSAFMYKKNNPSMANVVVQQPYNPLLRKQTYQENVFSQTEVDDLMIDESCPSEMSSFSKSAPYYSNKEMSGANEAQSFERKPRKYHSKRESLASSSSEFSRGSPSYGSFTTFEKIPIKNAYGEEEIITPVRRSSRIRNHHITSP